MPSRRRIYQSADSNPAALYAKKEVDEADSYPLLGSESSQLFTTSGINLPVYDFAELAISSETETYKFRTGGSSGTLVATVVIVYTDSNRTDLLTVTKT